MHESRLIGRLSGRPPMPGLSEGTRLESLTLGGAPFPVEIGEFWTAQQRQASRLHEVAYRACFKPQLPRFFIERLTDPGEVVYDPFSGRGTTYLEAALCGRVPWANDISPLSRILAAPRLEVPSSEEVDGRLAELPLQGRARAELDLSMFYHPDTESQLVLLRRYLLARREAGAEDGVDRWIRMVATNRLTGHSPGFFSVYSLPPNQAAKPQAQRRINERLKQEPPPRDVKAVIGKKSRNLMKDLSLDDRIRLKRIAAQARYLDGDARETSALEAGRVALVVTSPPFLDVVQYADDNWLRLWFNGLDAEAIAAKITMARTVAAWSGVMSGVFAELARLLRPGGHLVFEVGEVDRGRIRLEEAVVPLGLSAGLECGGILIHSQAFTKTANIWGVSNNARGTNTNRLVLFRKPGS
ncbi:MAG: site-specific DNA-methyltransferase [Spirochaetes bacterium]|nr:site-specific DNA-methyltransferase [Spirochaetota bacterium]